MKNGVPWGLFIVLPLASVLISGCQHFQPVSLSAERSASDFEARSLSDPSLKQFLEKNIGHHVDAWPLQSWDFPSLTLVAFYFHPSLNLSRAQWGVAQAGVQVAFGRPNPAGAVSIFPPAVSFDLPIEIAGKRGHKIAQAQQLSESARMKIATAAWEVRSNLRARLLDYTAAKQRAILLQKQSDIVLQQTHLLEARLSAGAVALPEVTSARVALIRNRADLAEAARQTAEAHARMGEALGLPAQAIEGVEFTFDGSDARGTSPAESEDLTSASVRREALLSRPDLMALLAEYAASQSALQLAIAQQYPDIRLGTGYQFDKSANQWTLGVTVDLPVFNQNAGPIAQADANRTETAARFIALQAEVIAKIDRALANRVSALAQLSEMKQLAEMQQARLQSAQAAFHAGLADRLDLNAAQLEATISALAEWDALVRFQQSIGQLEEALQRPFKALSTIEQGRSVALIKEIP